MKIRSVKLILLSFIYTCSACVHLKINEGIIKGRIVKNPVSEKVFYAFQQVPYAAPPIGNLRFQPPQPVLSWTGVLDTTSNSKICYQIGLDSIKETEDCLYLNVYTPQLPSNNQNISLPVMVFIHGGGFILGDSTHQLYGPEFLLNYDVIVVTFNYRLGVFGFLSTQDAILPGNYGLKDQLFALQWVNKNIHYFGGDATKVTIFGQSAGAASVGYHLVSDKSKGLYRGAIMESSTCLNPFGYQRNANYYAHKIAKLINDSISETSTSEEILNVMLKSTPKDIDVASDSVASEEYYDTVQLVQGYFYAPVIEPQSSDAFLTDKMFEIIDKGEASRVPVIIGINSEESISQTTDVDYLHKLMSLYDNDLKALVPNGMNIENESVKNETGKRIRELYTKGELFQNQPGASIRYMSDTSFTRPVIKYAELQSRFSPVYFYQFSYDGELGNVSIKVEGAEFVGHNEELAYIWRVSNDMFYNYDLSIFPTKDILTQKRILNLWTTFAKTLNPTPEKINLLQNITWPVVSMADNFPYLEIGENLTIKYRPKVDTFDGWSAIYQEFGVEPYDTF